ncbi:LysR family transcriptional regulator [Sphaerisporangium viridialbum]|uniref:LysR family transcriptional regulator n=1 Tax=Sphaerisporangium viridialbum TaxID=46189 RepID=UPI003C767BBB
MDLDLGLVADFLVLVEERHYGRAAVRLHLTSSALTKRIQRLEGQLGVALVERGPAGVLAVTSAGRRFAIAAEPLIAQANAARENVRATPAGRAA